MSRSVCQMLANLKKRKRKLLSCVFTFHKTWNKVVSHCSLVVTAKKCTKKCDTHAKLLLNLLFTGSSEGFQIWFTKKYSRALNTSYTFQPLMSFWSINIARSISTLYNMLQKWVLISAISLSVIFNNEHMYLPLHCLSYPQNIERKKKNAILIRTLLRCFMNKKSMLF